MRTLAADDRVGMWASTPAGTRGRLGTVVGLLVRVHDPAGSVNDTRAPPPGLPLGPDPAAVRLDDSPRDRGEPGSGRRARLLTLAEPLEHALLRLPVEALPGVLDDDDHVGRVALDADRHRSVRRRMAERVRDEVVEDPLDLCGSAARPRPGRVGAEMDAAGSRFGAEPADA